MALFDAYVMVEAAGPSLTAVERGTGAPVRHHPADDAAAVAVLADLLSDWTARGLTVLAGFDVDFGLPQGEVGETSELDQTKPVIPAKAGTQGLRHDLSSSLPLPLGPRFRGDDEENEVFQADAGRSGWEAMWRRFPSVTAAAGTRLTGPTPPRPGLSLVVPLHRHPWLAGKVRVWPFETGLTVLDRQPPGTVILAEVPAADAEQLDKLVRLDDAGRLGTLFAGDAALSDVQRQAVERQEGWILGVEGAAPTGYLRDPAAIYAKSFAIIRAEADLNRFTGPLLDVAVRVIHACGMPEVVEDIAYSLDAALAGQAALRAGRPVLVDVRMVDHGIIRRRLPAQNPVLCTLDDPRTAALAAELGTTRSAAAVELWRPHLDGAVVAIGNAPTALFHLLEMVAAGAARPAVVLGFAVGFVGAAESKEALRGSGLPHIVLRGRRGGSAMAAAAVNALAGGEA